MTAEQPGLTGFHCTRNWVTAADSMRRMASNWPLLLAVEQLALFVSTASAGTPLSSGTSYSWRCRGSRPCVRCSRGPARSWTQGWAGWLGYGSRCRAPGSRRTSCRQSRQDALVRCGSGFESGGNVGFGLRWFGIDFAARGVGGSGGQREQGGKGEELHSFHGAGKPPTATSSLPQTYLGVPYSTLGPGLDGMYSGVWLPICANGWSRKRSPTWEQ